MAQSISSMSDVTEPGPLASVADTVKVVGPAPDVGRALPDPIVGADWQNRAAGVTASISVHNRRLLRSMRFLPGDGCVAYGFGGALTVSVTIAGVAPPAGTARKLPAAFILAPLSSVICTP